ncbi:MAG: Bax inhibitor-1/YccA family protein [Deltaproteobacteria bacterium]|jgi:FtsH-binding integral membrane protein|nr:Bax inhibitor-1/YccA family protein [Deltaproteobacteria bacterium]
MIDFTTPNPSQSPSSASQLALTSEALFFQKVYLWMCGGLALSALVGYWLSGSEAWIKFLYSGSFSWIILFVVQLGVVYAIGKFKDTLSPIAIKGLFIFYAASVGTTMSIVILIYPSTVIFKAFISTAVIYGGMAAYGLLTKKSLQAWGGFLFMALIGLIVASLVNAFTKSPMLDYVICFVGVIIFAALTAYDHQKLRVIHAGGFQNQDQESNTVINGALELYLDFLNLFLFLVRILGASRD